jgi:2-polyprenyl-3-methyl-5-hydroxy-6-metoxy-1,4-benzoquinol methylase
MPNVKHEHIEDPVAAYDQLASRYPGLSRRRETYLKAVENCIQQRVPPGSCSMLDIGAGDGTRALRIAAASAIKRLILLEPSAGMGRLVSQKAEVSPIRAEELDSAAISERFDVITCLWNVLGHVRRAEFSARLMAHIARLLSPEGKFFIDVNHRYNVRAYGVPQTAARWIGDKIIHGETRGDVTASWRSGESTISTHGHVFTHGEVMRLAQAAGLAMRTASLTGMGDTALDSSLHHRPTRMVLLARRRPV